MFLTARVRNTHRWLSPLGAWARQTQGRRWACVAAAVCLVSGMALAQAKVPEEATPPPANSAIDAQLFFQLLVGEIQWRQGERSAAFELMLDAARRTKNEQLFMRATEMALQAKAGDQALVATKSWRAALPQSVAAHNYQAQLLVALNRSQEAVEPLRSLIALSPLEQKSALILTIQRFFARLPDRKVAAGLVEEILESHTKEPATRTASFVALARAWLAAQDKTRAWAFLQDSHAKDPNAVEPALLAAELMRDIPEAETVVTNVLKEQPKNTDLRLSYSRSLIASQRYADAIMQLEWVTQANPDLAGPWLTLGALHVELRHPQDGRKALTTYLQRLAAQESMAPAAARNPGASETLLEDESSAVSDKGQTEAWMQLAEAAEQESDYAAAESWLAKVADPQRAAQVAQRRASLLVKQGRLAEALSLVAALPDANEEAAKVKVFAQSQVLRDAKRWREAYAVLEAANERFPNETAVLYERAMVAEKLGYFDEMEAMLREVLVIKPDHQLAHNALGYSLADRYLRLPEAKTLIQRALELAPGDPMITDSLGWVEYRLGNLDEALRLLRWAFRARPDAEIGAHLGEVLWVIGQRDEARRIWRDARERDTSNEVLRETLMRLKVQL